jgi:hypothetical protein
MVVQVPSESVGVGVLARSRGWERLPPFEHADCGRWWPAQPRVQPGYPVPFPAPTGRAGGRDTRRWSLGHRPGRGSPRWPGCSSPGRVRWVVGLGLGGVAAGVRGVLDSWLPAAVPGRLCAAVQPAVGGLSAAESGGLTLRWSSESVCLYRKPLADSSSWMRGSTCRSAPLGRLEAAIVAAIPGGGLRAIARASGGALCPAQHHRPGPVRVVRGVALRRRSRKSSRLPSRSSGPCLSSRKFQSHRGVQAPRRG